MFWILLVIINIFILNLCAGVSRHINVLGVYPDVILVFSVYVALFGYRRRAIEASWVCGVLKDIAFGSVFGVNTVLFVWCGYIILKCRDNIFREHPVTHFLLNFVIIGMVTYITFLTESGLSSPGMAFSVAIRTSLISAGIAPFLYAALKRIPLPTIIPVKKYLDY